MQTLATLAWTTLETITADGIASCVIVDNFNGMRWQNTTKGTSGTFTDISVYNCGYANFEVSAGDTVQIYSNSSVARHIVVNIIGN